MSEMVQRAADAMVFFVINTGGKFCVAKRLADGFDINLKHREIVAEFDSVPDALKATREMNARAAIEAMRDPTPEMIEAGRFAHAEARDAGWQLTGLRMTEAGYQAMIDEALSIPSLLA